MPPGLIPAQGFLTRLVHFSYYGRSCVTSERDFRHSASAGCRFPCLSPGRHVPLRAPRSFHPIPPPCGSIPTEHPMVARRRFELPRTSCFEQVGSTIFPFVHLAKKSLRIGEGRTRIFRPTRDSALPLSYDTRVVVVLVGFEPTTPFGIRP